jgi:adenylosuccinate lyase
VGAEGDLRMREVAHVLFNALIAWQRRDQRQSAAKRMSSGTANVHIQFCAALQQLHQ